MDHLSKLCVLRVTIIGLVQLLVERGGIQCAVENMDQAACYRANPKTVRLLLDKGADTTITGDKYGSALRAAYAENNEEAAKLLLDGGADPNLYRPCSTSGLFKES